MGRNTPVPIRFDSSVREELETLTAASGLSLSDLCRLAVEKFLDEVTTTGSVNLEVRSRTNSRARPSFQPQEKRTKRLQSQNNSRAKNTQPQTSSTKKRQIVSKEPQFTAAQPNEPDFPL